MFLLSPAKVLVVVVVALVVLGPDTLPRVARQVGALWSTVTQFRARMEWYAQHPDRSNPLAHPMTDYIGYALPECRVSDAVCQLRPGYLSASPEVADELVGVS